MRMADLLIVIWYREQTTSCDLQLKNWSHYTIIPILPRRTRELLFHCCFDQFVCLRHWCFNILTCVNGVDQTGAPLDGLLRWTGAISLSRKSRSILSQICIVAQMNSFVVKVFACKNFTFCVIYLYNHQCVEASDLQRKTTNLLLCEWPLLKTTVTSCFRILQSLF